jgi:hypothetical protein
MYTTYPLPPIDTLNSHAGLILFSSIWIIAAMFTFASYADYSEFRKGIIVSVLVYFVPVSVVAIANFNTGEYKEFTNTKVTGTLQNIVAEGYNEEIKSGKSTRRQDVHLLYGIYEIEDKLVPILFQPGTPMPKHAVFYKNEP